jgi:iron(III) transport system ATP-binding protein
MKVSLRQVSKSFGDTAVLQEVSLEIADRELFFLLGPSGCGKTTLLRLLAGFYQPDAGDLYFGERRLNGVPPHQRNTGMVFQNYALWPHLTVAENVGYGLEVRRVPVAEKRERVREALAIVQMEAYASRSPNQLSGGQQQRVALARALVIRPDVLLLDEPLSNLDARLRLEMREEIRRIHDRTRITTIYVTHDQKEALSLADRLAVMRDGRIEQLGGAREIYRSPANRFVAEFIGECNWLAGELATGSDTGVTVRTAAGEFLAPRGRDGDIGPAVWLGFRPEAVGLGPAPVNTLTATIAGVTYLGDVEQYLLEIPGGVRLKACEQNPLEIRRPGAPLTLHVRPEDCFVLPRER